MVTIGKEQGVFKRSSDDKPVVSQHTLKGVSFNFTDKATKEDSYCNIWKMVRFSFLK